MENETEQNILRVARKHFVQKGYAAARMQEIADEAGINKAMLHYYFRSKDKLYNQVTAEIIATTIPRFAQAVSKEAPFWERLETMIDSYFDMLLEQPDIPIFILSELSQKRERFIAELKKQSSVFPAVQGFAMQMMQEMEAGNIRFVPPHHLFLNIVSMSVFPFVAKPIFLTIFELPESDFETMMKERKGIIMDFIRNALRVD